MPGSKHRFFVLVLSVSMTSLLLGGLIIGYYLTRANQLKLADPAFLTKRLEAVNKKGDGKRPSVRPPSLVRVEVARREKIGEIRPFVGRLVEVQAAKISTEVSGIVVQLPIEIGQQVKGGETLIAQIDKTWIDLNVEQTEAEIKILEAQYAHQALEAQRLEALAVSRAVSESELNNQRKIVEQFRRNLEKARIANREAQEKLKRTTILAPFDGYVIKREAGLGELLSPGMPIAEIVSMGHVDAIVPIIEDFVNRIKIGDQIPIVIDRYGIKVIGKVHSIVPYGPTGQRSFPVVVRLSDRDGELKVGMSVTALVSTADPTEEIVVSKNAVLDKPDGAIIWIVQQESTEEGRESDDERYVAQPIPVRIIAKALDSYGVEPETEEGRQKLVAGAIAVNEGAERLMPGQVVRITEINPKLVENLPPRSGHKIIQQKVRLWGEESE